MNCCAFRLRAALLGCCLAAILVVAAPAGAQAPLSEDELDKLEQDLFKAGAIVLKEEGQTWDVMLRNEPNVNEVIKLLQRLPSSFSLRASLDHVHDQHLVALAKLKNIHGLELDHNDQVTDAGIKLLTEVKTLKHLSLGSVEKITPAGLALLAQMPQLESLNLSGLKMEFQTKHLSKLTHLKRLDLSVCEVTDLDLIQLTSLKNLEVLILAHANISGEGLVNLAELTKLTELNLSTTSVDDAGLRHLARLTNLRELHLDRTQVSDAGLVHLAAMGHLEWLCLNRTQVRSAGMKHLAGMQKLHSLQLEVLEDFTGEGLENLAGCPELTRLDLRWAAVTDAGLAQIKRLPQVTSLLLPEYGIDHFLLSEFWDELHPERLSDAGLKHVGEMTDLEELQFSGAITDAGLAHLKPLQKLKRLRFKGVPGIKGPGLAHLKHLPKVIELDLSTTGVTDDGLQHLVGHDHLLILHLPPQVTAKASAHLQKIPKLKVIYFPREAAKEEVLRLRAALPGIEWLREF